MTSGSGFAFGPFQLDTRGGRLLRDGAVVRMPARNLRLLQALLSHPGETLTKDQLIKAAWLDASVTDNSLAQAMLKVRQTIELDGTACSIATEHGCGYRFIGLVEPIDVRLTDAALHTLLAPHRSFTEGRAGLETLSRDRIADARRIFDHLVSRHPQDAMAHVGLANACALAFEATRADAAQDVAALHTAAAHAREACRLNPDDGEAWATLGFVLERTGERADAQAALRRSVTLEPDNWRHQLRLAYGTWGEERLRAAHRVLALLPRCSMAHLLAATVFIARDALTQAERELDAGLAATADHSDPDERFTTVALHWLKGLLCLARHDEDQAIAAFQCELLLEPRGHLYARECCANTYYAIGACRLRAGDRPAARAAFEQAIARVPRHAMAHAGLALLAPASSVRELPQSRGSLAVEVASGAEVAVDVVLDGAVDGAVARAILRQAAGNADGAASLVDQALSAAPPGNAGWLLPIEPLLAVDRAHAGWARVLARLQRRAA